MGGKHTGDMADTVPLLQRRDEGSAAAALSLLVARGLCGVTVSWPAIIQMAYGEEFSLTNPEVVLLRRIAEDANRNSPDLKIAILRYVQWLGSIGCFEVARYFAEVGIQVSGEHVHPDLLYELAIFYRRASMFVEAAQTWDQLEQIGARTGSEEYRLKALNGKGMIYQRRGNMPEAERIFRYVRAEAVTCLEVRAHASVNLGTVLERTRRLPEAIEAYFEGFETYPKYLNTDKWRALHNVGVGMLKQGQLTAAIRAFWVVERHSHDWLLETTAMIDRLDAESWFPDNLEVRRLDQALALRFARMPDDMKVDLYYRLGLWAQREQRSTDRYWNLALDLAEKKRLGEWAYRIQVAQETAPATPEPVEDSRLVPIILSLDLLAATSLQPLGTHT